jgi:hypothetical protein
MERGEQAESVVSSVPMMRDVRTMCVCAPLLRYFPILTINARIAPYSAIWLGV